MGVCLPVIQLPIFPRTSANSAPKRTETDCTPMMSLEVLGATKSSEPGSDVHLTENENENTIATHAAQRPQFYYASFHCCCFL